MNFNVEVAKNSVIRWIQDYMADNCEDADTPVVIGLSGGKDSTVCAALCVKALGSENVIGILMPDITHENWSNRKDFIDGFSVAKILGIRVYNMPIDPSLIYANIEEHFGHSERDFTVGTNLPPRLRMANLYAVANAIGGRVCCTCNKSETYVGYDTRWGDQCGDFSPIQYFTAGQVVAIGKSLGIEELNKYIDAIPDDGMCGLTDEQRWGFTYTSLDTYLDGGKKKLNPEVVAKIEEMHRKAKYKIESIDIPHYFWPGEIALI